MELSNKLNNRSVVIKINRKVLIKKLDKVIMCTSGIVLSIGFGILLGFIANLIY